MTVLRILRHGPLLFWVVALVASVAVLTTAFALGDTSDGPKAPYRSEQQVIGAVDGWRASLAQLPVAIAAGTHAELATALAATAAAESTRSADADLMVAWDAAAAAATVVAGIENEEIDALYAGLHGLSLAGDRLAVVVSGGTWTDGPFPTAVPVGPIPDLPPGPSGPAGGAGPRVGVQSTAG